MKRLILAAALALAACQTPGAIGTTPPAPASQTVLDDKGFIVALSSLDTVLTAVDVLVTAGVIVPGTPKALQIQSYLIKARTAVKAAIAARNALDAVSYAEALANATAAFNGVSLLLKGN